MLNARFAILSLLLLGGCAGETEMRSVSSRTAEVLNSYRSSLQDFAAAQSRLNAQSEARIDRLNQMREMRRADIGARVDAWRIAGDSDAVRKFEVISATGADSVLAAANPRLPAAALPALKYDPGETDALIKPLTELSKPLTPRQRLEQLVAYAAAVKDSYEGDLKDAAASTAAAASGTAQKTVQKEAAEAATDAAQPH